MAPANLPEPQRRRLRELIQRGEAWERPTSPTLVALQARRLAKWETVPGRRWARWTPTDAGIVALTATMGAR